jgi:hypothetical protein
VYGGSTVNADIPIGSIEPWRTAAIQKAISLGNLPDNWDARGSSAPRRAVMQAAIDFLMKVPSIGAPRIVPISGGGYHFEWSFGGRELEVSLDENCRFEALFVDNGMPLEEDPPMNLAALFGWLISK